MKLGDRDKYWAFAGEMGRSLTRFLLGVMIARWVGPESYGIFVILITLEVVAHTCCNSVWSMPMTTLCPGLPAVEKFGLMQHALRRHWQGTLGVTGLFLLGYPLASGQVPLGTYLGFCATVLFAGGLNGIRSKYITTFRAKPMLLADGLATVLPLVAVLGSRLGPWESMLVYWWSRGLGSALALLALRFFAPISGVAGPTELGEFRQMGRFMLLGSVANSVCSRMQPFVMVALATPMQLGVFGAASALLGPMRMLAMALAGVLRPRLALHFRGGAWQRGWQMFQLSVGGLGGAGLIGVLGLVLLGDFVANLTFGAEFYGLGRVLPWAALYATLSSINSVVGIVIQTVDSAKTTAHLRILAGGVSLATIGPGIILGGEVGAFVSLLAAESVYGLAGSWRIRQVCIRQQASEHPPGTDSGDRPEPVGKEHDKAA